MNAPIPIRERLFFTPMEVAGHLGISVDTVWRLMRWGKINYIEISPRTRRIPREELTSFARKELHCDGKAAWES